jgi:hypothetical protein
MIIMFGFKYEHTPDSNSISLKLLGLKEGIEGDYDGSKFDIESSGSLFQSKYSISIFNLPDSSEIDVKKRIDDFINQTSVEVIYE